MESHNKGAVAGVILNPKNEILLQFKDSGYPWFQEKWCCFGGAIEPGEDPEDTFLREMQEELGGKLKDMNYFRCYKDITDIHRDGRKSRIYDVHVFGARYTGKVSDIRLGEGGGFVFLSRNSLDTHPIIEHDKKFIKDYLDHYLR